MYLSHISTLSTTLFHSELFKCNADYIHVHNYLFTEIRDYLGHGFANYSMHGVYSCYFSMTQMKFRFTLSLMTSQSIYLFIWHVRGCGYLVFDSLRLRNEWNLFSPYNQ